MFICNAIPFIGFGFLDNGIMILAVSLTLVSLPVIVSYEQFFSSF